VVRLSPSGTGLPEALRSSELGFAGLGYPAAVAVDDASNVYVTDTVSNQVLKLPAARYNRGSDGGDSDFCQDNEPEASDSRHKRTTIRRVMTPSTPWANERGQLPHRLRVRNQILGRRQARRLSRRFARLGVTTPPERLRQMLAGAPAAYAEVADFNFALIATQLKREQFAAKIVRLKRRGTRLLIFVGLVLVTLNFLFCMAYALFSLTLEASPL
jgi:hypothetical protein